MNPDQRVLRALADSPQLAPLKMEGSPMAEALRARLLKADGEACTVEVSFQPDEVFTQAAGVVQGGAVAAMLDFALAYAALLAAPDGHSVATATLNVNFLRPCLHGCLQATGRVERRGRSLVFSAAELRDGEGHCVATASAALPVVAWRA